MSKINTIVTGQQVGLLGGPLYTTYKVLGIIHLAAKINGNAVYWLETNDADFNEINHIDYLDAEGQLRTLTWDINSQGYSCGFIEVDESLVNLLETFFSTLRQTEFTPQLRDMALGCYLPGQTLAEASQQLAAELFGDFDVRIFTPFEKEFREFSQTILIKEAERTPEGEQCNLFCMQGKQRKAVFKKDSQFQLRDGSVVDLSQYDLVPNVNTRSICQDAYFHTHTYVAGPGEVKYLSELGPVFQFHGVKNAVVQSRMSISLIEPRVQRLMNKTGLSLEQILESTREELIKKVLKEKTTFDISETLQTGNDLTEEYLGKLEGLGLEAADIKSLRKSLRQDVKQALGKVRAKEKEKHQRLLTDVGYLSDNLQPFGEPQERVFNIFYYMNLFGGKDFINWIYDHYDWERKVLEIKVGV
ncbi:MAG: bacillithiol biosynthesis BshC [Candidatus Aminicenantes bacterium]|nr:bacillithiol biosynthesis BshC [Candidatus Aminicenantes bacterium]NIM81567.1 bacillithiol biosynthesis BshC [Candidatus Aminicenantes bacterium]NIN20938.1 bacillithiol biosynthesis BshC [Candidatus Aminicenantes bacterium]NIN44759.1 bacillithiol biosynthesis BshC [Candidatus Aminicenantes bacterium]NIN87567.1 bacillithiol biosynthesis BshC [Candidatus Aminicenantes bacterium]